MGSINGQRELLEWIIPLDVGVLTLLCQFGDSACDMGRQLIRIDEAIAVGVGHF